MFHHFSETDIGNQSWYKYVVPCHPSLLGSLIAKSDMKSLIEFVASPSKACIAQRRLHGVLHKASHVRCKAETGTSAVPPCKASRHASSS